MEKLEVRQGDSLHSKNEGILDLETFPDPHGSNNLLQRAILYRHKELYLRRKDWSFKPCETMYIFESGFLDFLRIGQFVWARAWCGTRYDHSGPGEIHPATRKIHMEKLEVRQGDSTYYKNEEFSIWRRFRTPNDPSGTQKRALTRNGFYTWLEEFASWSNTIHAQGIISAPGRLELQTM